MTKEPQESVKYFTNTADALGDNDEAQTPAQEPEYLGGAGDRTLERDASGRLDSFRKRHKRCVNECWRRLNCRARPIVVTEADITVRTNFGVQFARVNLDHGSDHDRPGRPVFPPAFTTTRLTLNGVIIVCCRFPPVKPLRISNTPAKPETIPQKRTNHGNTSLCPIKPAVILRDSTHSVL